MYKKYNINKTIFDKNMAKIRKKKQKIKNFTNFIYS